MGLFSKKTSAPMKRQQSAPVPDHHSHMPQEIAYVYTGTTPFAVSLQRSKNRWINAEARPMHVVWDKRQRLGLTFYEKRHGGISVKSIASNQSQLSVGQELIGVNGLSVAGLDINSVMRILQAAASPCELQFTPPPSPILVHQVAESACRLGIHVGMILKAVNGVNMIGASLEEVNDAICGARPNAPSIVTFAVNLNAQDQDASTTAIAAAAGEVKSSKGTLRNTLCIGAVVAALSV